MVSINVSLSFPFQTNVSYFPSQNIWNGPHGGLHAFNGFPTSGRQALQVSVLNLFAKRLAVNTAKVQQFNLEKVDSFLY